MLLDHIGMIFSSQLTATVWGSVLYTVFRVLGRLTAPIMCFFLAQGFIYTHSKKQYAIRLAIFALLSQIPYALARKHSLLTPDFNMIFVLLISFAILCIWESRFESVPKIVLLVILTCLSLFCDWGLFAPLMVLFFYVFRADRKNQIMTYCLLAILVNIMSCVILPMNGYPWYQELWQLGLFLFIPLLFIYNGQPGSRAAFHKWFFYIFYPAHLLLLWGLAKVISLL